MPARPSSLTPWCFRASLVSRIGLGVLTGFPFAIFLFVGFFRGWDQALVGGLVSGALFAGIQLWLASYRLEFDGTSLRYRSLRRRESVELTQVANVRFAQGFNRKGFPPPLRLEVNTSEGKALRWNLKPFPRSLFPRLRQLFPQLHS